jgi:hypothetical protein
MIGFCKKRKAQITIFIIIGVLIVAIVGAVVYFGKLKVDADLSNWPAELKPQVENIQESIINCRDDISKEALVIIGIQGGYHNAPAQSVDLSWGFIPYYYNEGAYLMPSNEVIEGELEDYVNDNLNYCIESINLGSFTLDSDVPKTEVSIKKTGVLFKIDESIIIEKEKNKVKFELKEHPIEQASKLYQILEIADYITESHREDPDFVCINCVAEMAQEREVYVDMLEFDETTTKVMILENKTSEEPYLFEFLNKYVALG